MAGDDEANASVPVTLEFGTGADAVETAVGTGADTDVPALLGDDPGIDGSVTVDEPGVAVSYVGDGRMDPDISGTVFEVDANEVVLDGIDMGAADASTATGIAVEDGANDVVLDGVQITGSDWAQAIDVSGDRTEIRYVDIRDTDNGVVNVGDGLIVRNSQFRNNDGYAVELTSDRSGNSASNATIRDNNFVGNNRALFADAGSHTMKANNIERNDAAIETVGTESQVFIDAPDNWWGSAAGPAVAENPGVSEEEADILSNVEFPSPESAPYNDAVFSVVEPESDTFEVTQGETLTLEATIRNDGGTAGTSNRQTIELLVNGGVVDTQTIDGLGTNQSETVELAYTPPTAGSDDLSATIRSVDDSVLVNVSVTEPVAPGSGNGDTDGDSDGTEGDDDSGDSGETADEPPAPPEDLDEIEVTAAEIEVPETRSGGDQQVAEFDTVDTVESITFQTDQQVGEVQVSDIEPDTNAIDTPGSVVAVQDITVPNESADTAATIEFNISQDRLNEIEAPPEALRVYRGVDDGQEPLETSVEAVGNNTTTVTAETPGFSVFSVSAVSEPDAVINLGSDSVETGDEVVLAGTDSETEYGEIVAYEWSIAGETLTGETAQTAFDEAGEYTVELTVTTDAGETDTTTADIVVEAVGDGTDGDETTGDGTADDEATDDGTPGDGTADDGATDDGDIDGPVEEPGALDTGVIAVVLILALIVAAGVILLRRQD
ncbi:PKD domain-containing protein [Halorubrum sp. AS12]|uniref:PKD domain-containing protein n=1 Tax=Halorubrum sp. AS12 TaxID=3409687 RepID=UPI003DA77E0D